MLIEQQGEYENEGFAETELTIIWDQVRTHETLVLSNQAGIQDSQCRKSAPIARGTRLWLPSGYARKNRQVSKCLITGSLDVYSFSLRVSKKDIFDSR